jgi:hypothetical protein
MQSERVEPEMALILACCRWPPSPEREAAVHAATADVDWDRVLVLARRHRVQGLVHHALVAAAVTPDGDVSGHLQEEARAIAKRNLQLAAASVSLVRKLEAAGVPVMVIKGTALAALAYGTLATKMAWDIDLLITPDALDAAADVLEEGGYRCTLPGGARADLATWHRFSKESVWKRGDVHVELHDALVDSPAVLPGINARGAAQRVAVSPGMTLPTLERDALFAYLCVHGAASGWRRAKWLADVGALLSEADVAEVERLHEASQVLGAGRAAGQALLLAHRFLAVPVPDALLSRLRRDWGTRLMTRMAARMLTAADGFDDPRDTAAGTMPIHLMQMMILPGWRFVGGELRRKAAPDPRLGPMSRVRRVLYPAAALVRRLSRAPQPGGA